MMGALIAGGPRDFCMPLSDLGKPDQYFANFWKSNKRRNDDSRDPGLAKWTVQQGPGLYLVPDHLHNFYFHGDGKDKKVEVHFTGKTLDGAVFASSRENGPPVTFVLTQENVIQGFIDAISTMQPGDKSVFTIAPEFAVTKSGCPASIPWNIPPNQTLRFDVELISLITDVLQDQCILKKTIKLGSEDKDHPGDLDEVFVKYTACLKDGTLVSTSEGVEFSLAEGFFCPAFAHALKTMKEGEGALLIVKPKYGFGEQGRPAMGNEAPVPPDATLHVNLQLMSWINVSRIGENQEILKKVLHQDQSKPLYSIRWKIMNQAVVKVRLIGKLEDGTVFDRRGHDGDEPFEFTIDEGPTTVALQLTIFSLGSKFLVEVLQRDFNF